MNSAALHCEFLNIKYCVSFIFISLGPGTIIYIAEAQYWLIDSFTYSKNVCVYAYYVLGTILGAEGKVEKKFLLSWSLCFSGVEGNWTNNKSSKYIICQIVMNTMETNKTG